MQFVDFPLETRLQRAIQSMGFTAPTPIQEGAIPPGLAGRDLIGTATTGTGKTVAFVLPLLQRLLTQPASGRRTRALVLTPTRELADQILQTIQQLSQFTALTSATVYGGVSMGPQERALRSGVDILVACPGRLLDHIQRGTAVLERVEALVLDEADRMLDMGFLPSVKRILAVLPRERQTMLFSATFAPELGQLAAQTLRNPVRIDAGVGAPARTVAHALFPVAPHLKTALLLELLGQTATESVLVFTRTKHRANRLLQQLQKAGHPAAVLHSGRSQNQRMAALDGFRAGRFQLLVATDIAARGLDIDSISHVMNYDIPDTADTYIHRIGRTGRAEREGDALTLVSPEDAPTVRDIERALKSPIARRTLAGFDYHQQAPAVGRASEDRRGSSSNNGARSGDSARRPEAGAGGGRGRRPDAGGRSAAPERSGGGASPQSGRRPGQPVAERPSGSTPQTSGRRPGQPAPERSSGSHSAPARPSPAPTSSATPATSGATRATTSLFGPADREPPRPR